MNLPEDFVFSQSSLQDYVDCPRRFELRYLLKQRWPAPEVDEMLEFEQRMGQGERFHQLVHQHLVGIPPETLKLHVHDDAVERWFDVYLQTGLTIVPDQRHPEIILTVSIGDYNLLAKFDVLAIEPGQRIVIIDWKTSRNMPPYERLEARMQTVVYRYVVAKGGAHLNGRQPIAPEQIEMVYWFADHAGQTHRFGYSEAQLHADEARLLSLMNEINTRTAFPLTENTHSCRFCPFRSLCDRGTQAGSLVEWEADVTDINWDTFTIDIDQIAEIEY